MSKTFSLNNKKGITPKEVKVKNMGELFIIQINKPLLKLYLRVALGLLLLGLYGIVLYEAMLIESEMIEELAIAGTISFGIFFMHNLQDYEKQKLTKTTNHG